jgi:hypothetical protein
MQLNSVPSILVVLALLAFSGVVVVVGVPLIARGGRYPGGRSYGYGFRPGYRGHNGYGQYGKSLIRNSFGI